MIIAFYKAFQSHALWTDKLIAYATFSKYSHCEIIFSDGIAYSVSMRDKMARFKKIDFDPNHWDFIEIDVSPEEEGALRINAHNRVLDKIEYDIIGALFSGVLFLTKLDKIFKKCIEDRNKTFCSEEISYLLKNNTEEYSHLDKGCKYFPGRLYAKLK